LRKLISAPGGRVVVVCSLDPIAGPGVAFAARFVPQVRKPVGLPFALVQLLLGGLSRTVVRDAADPLVFDLGLFARVSLVVVPDVAESEALLVAPDGGEGQDRPEERE
jgi:hypothetical protein